ncbi:MAG TPA: response regulator transcription factor [Coleofasciculaceae cyanobacterium]
MKRILLIEDDDFLRSLICEAILTTNYQVVTAENGRVGLRLATELEPDLIISDMNMPYLNGDEVLKQVRANFKTAHIPFIFLTSEQKTSQRVYAFKLGANDYLTKPFKTRELLNAIAAQIETQYPCSLMHEKVL